MVMKPRRSARIEEKHQAFRRAISEWHTQRRSRRIRRPAEFQEYQVDDAFPFHSPEPERRRLQPCSYCPRNSTSLNPYVLLDRLPDTDISHENESASCSASHLNSKGFSELDTSFFSEDDFSVVNTSMSEDSDATIVKFEPDVKMSGQGAHPCCVCDGSGKTDQNRTGNIHSRSESFTTHCAQSIPHYPIPDDNHTSPPQNSGYSGANSAMGKSLAAPSITHIPSESSGRTQVCTAAFQSTRTVDHYVAQKGSSEKLVMKVKLVRRPCRKRARLLACRYCATFQSSDRSERREHVATVHPHRCSLCCHRFCTKEELLIHRTDCEAENLRYCFLCQKNYCKGRQLQHFHSHVHQDFMRVVREAANKLHCHSRIEEYLSGVSCPAGRDCQICHPAWLHLDAPPEDSDLNPDGLEFGTREPTEEEGGVAVSVPEDRTDVGDMVINLLELCNQFDLASAVRSCDEWDGQTMVVDNEGEDVGGSESCVSLTSVDPHGLSLAINEKRDDGEEKDVGSSKFCVSLTNLDSQGLSFATNEVNVSQAGLTSQTSSAFNQSDSGGGLYPCSEGASDMTYINISDGRGANGGTDTCSLAVSSSGNQDDGTCSVGKDHSCTVANPDGQYTVTEGANSGTGHMGMHLISACMQDCKTIALDKLHGVCTHVGGHTGDPAVAREQNSVAGSFRNTTAEIDSSNTIPTAFSSGLLTHSEISACTDHLSAKTPSDVNNTCNQASSEADDVKESGADETVVYSDLLDGSLDGGESDTQAFHAGLTKDNGGSIQDSAAQPNCDSKGDINAGTANTTEVNNSSALTVELDRHSLDSGFEDTGVSFLSDLLGWSPDGFTLPLSQSVGLSCADGSLQDGADFALNNSSAHQLVENELIEDLINCTSSTPTKSRNHSQGQTEKSPESADAGQHWQTSAPAAASTNFDQNNRYDAVEGLLSLMATSPCRQNASPKTAAAECRTMQADGFELQRTPRVVAEGTGCSVSWNTRTCDVTAGSISEDLVCGTVDVLQSTCTPTCLTTQASCVTQTHTTVERVASAPSDRSMDLGIHPEKSVPERLTVPSDVQSSLLATQNIQPTDSACSSASVCVTTPAGTTMSDADEDTVTAQVGTSMASSQSTPGSITASTAPIFRSTLAPTHTIPPTPAEILGRTHLERNTSVDNETQTTTNQPAERLYRPHLEQTGSVGSTRQTVPPTPAEILGRTAFQTQMSTGLLRSLQVVPETPADIVGGSKQSKLTQVTPSAQTSTTRGPLRRRKPFIPIRKKEAPCMTITIPSNARSHGSVQSAGSSLMTGVGQVTRFVQNTELLMNTGMTQTRQFTQNVMYMHSYRFGQNAELVQNVGFGHSVGCVQNTGFAQHACLQNTGLAQSTCLQNKGFVQSTGGVQNAGLAQNTCVQNTEFDQNTGFFQNIGLAQSTGFSQNTGLLYMSSSGPFLHSGALLNTNLAAQTPQVEQTVRSEQPSPCDMYSGTNVHTLTETNDSQLPQSSASTITSRTYSLQRPAAGTIGNRENPETGRSAQQTGTSMINPIVLD